MIETAWVPKPTDKLSARKKINSFNSKFEFERFDNRQMLCIYVYGYSISIVLDHSLGPLLEQRLYSTGNFGVFKKIGWICEVQEIVV